jgi:hypothetical protein
VDELIAEKVRGERVVARESQMDKYRSDIEALKKKMSDAEARHPLPPDVAPAAWSDLNEFLMTLRYE